MEAANPFAVAAPTPFSVRMPHIAFIGKAGVGKTTAAQFLEQHWPYVRYNFAGPLKSIAVRLWGPGASEDRDKLQRLGMAVRDIQPDTWLRLLETSVTGLREDKRAVIDDCRFLNEWELLNELGFVFVRITAPIQTRVDRLMGNGKLTDEAQLKHISEVGLDDVPADHVIHNDGTDAELEDQIVRVLNREVARA